MQDGATKGYLGRRMRLLVVNPNVVTKREHMHIGIATVASYVRAHSDHDVRVLDFMATPRFSWRLRLRKALEAFRPDVVGMYISSPYFPVAREVAASIKHFSNIPIVAGGHHATLAPEEVLAVPHFDWLIEGEGEVPMLRLLDTLAAHRPLSDVPGLCYRRNGGIERIPKAPLLEADRWPTVDWALFGDEIVRTNFFIWGILPVMASRGCPATCSFCSTTEIQKRYPGERFLRFRDPAQVVREIGADFEKYGPLGLRQVQFTDLNFLLNVRWLAAFTAEYRRSGLNRKLPWSAFTRPDHVTPAAIECLRDSGCVNLRVGIEAANPEMRNDVYRKGITQEVLETGIRRIRDAGISITGYFMAGGPGERPEWLLESLDLAHRAGVDFPVFFLYKPLASSEVLTRAAALGSHLREDAEDKATDLLHGVSMHHEHITEWQLTSFVLLTHALFGARLVRWQIGRTGWSWFAKLARYMTRALRMGFTPYGAFTYFVYYGADHLSDPYRAKDIVQPSKAWEGMMALTRIVLPPSAAKEPKSESVSAADRLDP